jgi:hypothetical protein
MLRTFFAGAALVALASAPACAQTRFPFSLPWDDASKNALDASDLNPAPISQAQRLTIKNGHFFDQTGRRVRFLGTGLSASANFSRPEDSARFAARLHKFGFNIVRLHHMDASWSNPNIFGSNRDNYTQSNAQVSPQSLDLLDHTISNLKQNGLYVDLNLHVSRAPSPGDGFPDTNKIPEMGKVVAFFEPRFIALQKDYARQLLEHKNPYTGLRLADDPAVALVEINNEDSLVAQAWSGTLQDLPTFYRTTLRVGWNKFLKARYATTGALRKSWNAPPEGADAPNLLQNARFQNATEGWQLETQEGAKAQLSVVDVAGAPADGPPGKALRVAIDALPDQGWKLQLHQTGLDLKPDSFYTLSFWARSDAPRRASSYFALDQAPWSQVGGNKTLSLSTEWTLQRMAFKTGQTVPAHTRVSLALGNAKDAVEIADVKLVSGALGFVPASQKVEQGTLDLPPAQGATPGQGRDWIEFLSAVEASYVATMRDTIKRESGFKGAVTCSQASYGGMAGIARESASDWTDMHAYWQHPDFPGQPWDPKNWRISNTAMLDDPNSGTLLGLATHRVEGKPFTVSEYNQPAPNDYASETLPLILSYAAIQDWDGVFLFDYNTDGNNWNPGRIRGFFDTDSDPNKMAFAPAMARAFLSGALPPAKAKTTLLVPKEALLELASQTQGSARWDSFFDNAPAVWRANGLSTSDVLGSRIALRLVPGAGEARLERSGERTVRAGNPAFDWSFSGTRGRLVMDSASVKALVGRVGSEGSSFWPLGALSIASPRSSNGWVSLVAVARDGKPLEGSNSILLSALCRAENANMTWNTDRTSVGDGWGDGPPQLETPSATLELRTRAKSAQVWKLDATGKRTNPLPSTLLGGKLKFSVAPADATPFYEIALEPGAAQAGATR